MEEAVKERENLYKLIISQLRYDGCEAIASSLAKTTNIISPCPPTARLHQVVNLGLRAEAEGARPENNSLPGLTNNLGATAPAKGIDLEYEPEEYDGHHPNGQVNHQKPGSSSDSGGESDRENVPPREVQEHILRITKNKIAAEEIKVIRSNGEVTFTSDELCADNVCLRVKQELQKMNISQEVFAKCVLGKTQGYLSEMLKHGEKVFYSREKANSKGRVNFEKMRMFLLKPEDERRVIYAEKARQLRDERLLRKRMSFTMAYSPLGSPYDDKPPLCKSKCYSPTRMDEGSSSQHPTNTGTPSQFSRIVASPHFSSESHPIIIKTESLTSPTETTGYKNLPHPRSLCNRLMFMREDPPPSELTSYHYIKKEPEEIQVDKNLVTTKIAALSRKQLTPSKARQQPSPEHYGTTTGHREPESPHHYGTTTGHRQPETPHQYRSTTGHREPESPHQYRSSMGRRESETSSSGIPEDVVTIETLPLQSLAADDNDDRPEPLVIRREPIDRRQDEPRRYRYERHTEYVSDGGRPEPYEYRRQSFDPSKVEIGESVYVVQVDGTDAIRVTNSL